MNPILYESRETDFNHNGLGKMSETLSAIVTEVANGEFELEVVYPIGGRLYKHIQDHMLIKAKPNSVDDPHVFRIYEHVIDTVGQTVTMYAHTKSNDLGQNLVKDVVINSLTPQEAMNSMKMNLVEPTDYSFVSDVTTRSSTKWENRNPLNCIAGEEGSLIHYWGGEIKRDNRTIYLYRRRGRDNVAIIRDGKNINGLSLEYSTKGMVTKIIPYRTYTPENSDDEIVEYGTPVESKYIGNYPVVYVRAIDYSNDDDVTSLQTMNTKASRYFTENNGVDKPSVNVNVNLVELSDSSEYEKFKDFENVELFDTVTVYSKQYDINIEAKITTVVYDSLTGKNVSLEMGSYRTGLIESTERSYIELIGEKEAKLVQTIQVAANGKNRVFRGVDEPATGMVKNDIWYQPVGAGETMMYVFDGAYWQLNKVSAGLLGGTLDAENGDVNLINVNVANIVGDTSNFIKSWWNEINNQVEITGSNMTISNNKTGEKVVFRDGKIDFTLGANGRHLEYNTEGLILRPFTGNTGTALNTSLHLVGGGTGSHQYINFLSGDGIRQRITALDNNMYINIGAIKGRVYVRGPKGEVRSGGITANDFETDPDNNGSNLTMVANLIATPGYGSHHIYIRPQGTGVLHVGDGTNYYDIRASAYLNSSSIKFKTNIENYGESALDKIMDLRVVSYDLKKDIAYGVENRQIGFIAEDSPSISSVDGGSIDLYKLGSLTAKAIQELTVKVNELSKGSL